MLASMLPTEQALCICCLADRKGGGGVEGRPSAEAVTKLGIWLQFQVIPAVTCLNPCNLKPESMCYIYFTFLTVKNEGPQYHFKLAAIILKQSKAQQVLARTKHYKS